MNCFILLSAPRSGSTYLRYLLSSHTNVYMAEELLNGNPEYARKHGDFSKNQRFLRNTDIIKYLNTFFSQQFPDNITHVGFSIFYDQARSHAEQCVWRYLADMPDLAVIHLQRLNTLSNLVSLKNVRATRKWLRRSDEPVMTYAPFKLDYAECIKFFENRKKEIQESNHLFSGRRSLDITYENLIANNASVLQQLLGFLGLENQQLHSESQIQNKQTLTELVTNYGELKESFRNSEWEWFFDE